MIVFFHAVEANDYLFGQLKFVFTCFCVPFFFITSGFLFAHGLEKAENKKQYFIRYEKNVLIHLTIWTIIYLPFITYQYIVNNTESSVIRIILLIIRRVVVIGAGPYWYLVALFWSIAFIYICYRINNITLLYIAIIMGIILEILYSCFRTYLSSLMVFKWIFDLFYTVFSWENNFIMYGIPFAGFGYLVFKKDINLPMLFSVILCVFTTILRGFEYNLSLIFQESEFWSTNQLSVAFIPQAIAVFFIAKNITININTTTSKTIRELSSFIYYFHAILMWEIIDKLFVKFTNIDVFGASFVFPKMILTCIGCIIVFWIIKKINNKYLNILINA